MLLPPNRVKMKRFLHLITVLLLVASAGGQVIAATLCPRMSPSGDCCVTSTMSPHDHGRMMPMSGMDAMNEAQPSPASEKNLSASLALPVEACAHCMSHSGLVVPSWGKARVSNDSRHGLAGLTPQTSALSLLPPAPFSSRIPSNKGAPPGDSKPRYILISLLLI